MIFLKGRAVSLHITPIPVLSLLTVFRLTMPPLRCSFRTKTIQLLKVFKYENVKRRFKAGSRIKILNAGGKKKSEGAGTFCKEREKGGKWISKVVNWTWGGDVQFLLHEYFAFSTLNECFTYQKGLFSKHVDTVRLHN